ncbi:MAG: hypothetical protein R3F20_02305 [Planctomycetota bacterium]
MLRMSEVVVRLTAGLCLGWLACGAMAQAPASGLVDRWRPAPALLEAAAKLVDPAVTEAWIEEGLDRHRIDVLRAGLRLPDGRAALVCASALEAKYLDAWESERVVALCLPHAFTPGTPVDFGTRLRWIMGSADLPALFAAMPAGKPWSEKVWLGKIHVIMRSDHAPLACRYLPSEDPRIRDLAAETLEMAISYDDRYREEISSAILTLAGREPEDAKTGGGLPPRLAALLDWVFSERFESELDGLGIGGLARDLPGWTLRWLGDEKPGAADEARLIRLALTFRGNEDVEPAPRGWLLAVLGAVAKLESATSLDFLRASQETEDEFVSYALYKRGGTEAAEPLVSGFGLAPFGFALLLDAAPAIARGFFRRAYHGEEGEQMRMLKLLDEMEWESLAGRLRWDPAALASIRSRLLWNASEEPLKALAFALRIRGAATEEIADVVLDEFIDSGIEPEDATLWDGALRGDQDTKTVIGSFGIKMLAFLEAARPEKLRTLFRLWAADEDPDSPRKRLAYRGLLIVGDPESGRRLVEHVAAADEGSGDLAVDTGIGAWDVLLARSATAEVREFLRHRWESAQDPRANLQAVAAAGGLPERAGEALDQIRLGLEVDARERVDALVLAGKPIEALNAALRAHPPDAEFGFGFIVDLGFVRDEGVAEWLREFGSRRELGLHARATGALAMMGDPVALAETRAVLRAGRYGWLDEVPDEVVTEGFDPATVPWSIDELRSQCCRITSGSAIYHLFDGPIETKPPEGGSGMTPYEWAVRSWLPGPNRRLVWSELTRRFIRIDR